MEGGSVETLKGDREIGEAARDLYGTFRGSGSCRCR